jgi:peptide/nickel transport system permease protein
MIRYFFQKIGYGLLITLGVVFILSFLFFSFLNKDQQAVYEMTGQRTDPKEIDRIRKEYHMDLPVMQQVILYLNDLSPLSIHSSQPSSRIYFHEDLFTGFKVLPLSAYYSFYLKQPYLRRSYQNNQSVAKILKETLPNTIVLALSSILFASFFGILLGIVCFANKETWIDKSILFFSTLGMSFPSFFVAILFSWLFGYVLHAYTGLETWGTLFEIDDYTGEKRLMLKNLILPSLTLGIRPLSVIIQLTRQNIADVMQSDYIRTARAKGLTDVTILFRHALRNALNPVITAISGWLGTLLAGAVFVEYIFGWKGIGKEIVNGLQKLDYPVVMGCMISISMMFVIINLLVDVLYGWLDPKIRK